MAVPSGSRILSGRNADPFFCKAVIFLKIQPYRIDRGTQDHLILIGIQQKELLQMICQWHLDIMHRS